MKQQKQSKKDYDLTKCVKLMITGKQTESEFGKNLFKFSENMSIIGGFIDEENKIGFNKKLNGISFKSLMEELESINKSFPSLEIGITVFEETEKTFVKPKISLLLSKNKIKIFDNSIQSVHTGHLPPRANKK